MDMLKDFAETPEKCCACGACISACPTQPKAMNFVENEEGFLYPQIDEDRCIHCKACERACFYRQGIVDWPDKLSSEKISFAIQMKDAHTRLHCQSGGMSSLLVNAILSKGGIVYGCILDEHFDAVYNRIEAKPEDEKLRGSKYVQASTNGIYESVKSDLKKGRIVLFLGTPCYTEGLLSYLHGKFRENLLLVDIICHGVPSPKLWRDFLSYRKNQEGKEITKVNFRDKEHFGWHSHVESIWFGDKRRSSTIYTTIFYSHLALRHSCLVCPFTSTNRHSDITLGDCWSLEKNLPSFDDNCGTSLVIINTKTGRKWFNFGIVGADVIPIDLKDYMQPQLQYPSTCDSKSRAKFWNDYKNKGYSYIFKKYGRDSLYWKIRKKVASIKLIRIVVNSIRKIIQ